MKLLKWLTKRSILANHLMPSCLSLQPKCMSTLCQKDAVSVADTAAPPKESTANDKLN